MDISLSWCYLFSAMAGEYLPQLMLPLFCHGWWISPSANVTSLCCHGWWISASENFAFLYIYRSVVCELVEILFCKLSPVKSNIPWPVSVWKKWLPQAANRYGSVLQRVPLYTSNTFLFWVSSASLVFDYHMMLSRVAGDRDVAVWGLTGVCILSNSVLAFKSKLFTQ